MLLLFVLNSYRRLRERWTRRPADYMPSWWRMPRHFENQS